jgi:molybdopterin/thiamine biosynthesis adenylyltransferase
MIKVDRSDRQRRLHGWDQARLSAATVVVVGVGALGNTVAEQLALVGVGRLILVDPDVVETSNLARTPLFRAVDVGAPKVNAAARSLAELAPEVLIEPRQVAFERGVGLGELAAASLIVGCLDSRRARLALASRRGLVGAPWIDAATGDWSGEVRIFLDPEGPCYGCGVAPEDRGITDVPWSCGDPTPETPHGAAAPLSGTVGSLAAMLAVRALMGLSVEGGVLSLDPTGAVRRVEVTRTAHCPYHRRITPDATVPLGPEDSVGALRSHVVGTPLAWDPVISEVRCRVCGHRGRGPAGPCPACGSPLQARTTIELDRVAADSRLASFGIPSREWLAVRGADAALHIVALAR